MWGLYMMAIHTIFTDFTEFINRIQYIYVLEILLYTLSFVKEKKKHILVLDIASKGTRDANLN